MTHICVTRPQWVNTWSAARFHEISPAIFNEETWICNFIVYHLFRQWRKTKMFSFQMANIMASIRSGRRQEPRHQQVWYWLIVRRAGLLWSQRDFEWRWSVPLFKCLTVLEFSFILFDLCLLITFFNFIMNYVPIVTFWIFTYHKIWILSIMFCSIWSYWIIYFLACLEVSWRVVS